MRNKKPAGYVVSSPRHRDGVYVRTMSQARKEMDRQMRTGVSQSGIREIWGERNYQAGKSSRSKQSSRNRSSRSRSSSRR